MEFQSPLVHSENYSSAAWPTRFERNLDREGSPSISLRLGIGAGTGGPIVERRPIFTAQQLHELNHQALIFKYIVSGLSVPVHLVLPILKCVSCSFGSAYPGICNPLPSSLGFSHQGYNQQAAMDPEPGRCRRTDGKRWRCSKNAISGQKYCERHMNRGNQRSRKHVEEASRNISLSHKKTETTTPNTKSNDSYLRRVNVNDRQCSVNIGTETNAKTTSGVLNGGYMDQRTGSYCSYNGGKSKFARFSDTLQGGTGANSSPGSESRILVDTEPKRCKRTDGKKWQCSHEVVAEQKYCARHIHRGVKKTKLPSETVTVTAPPPPIVIHEKGTINLNTRLSISVPETCSNEGHSSSSDATTITDENTSFARASVLFPQ